MIFETLAAMAQYDREGAERGNFDFTATAAECKTLLTDVVNTGAKTVIIPQTLSGVMNVTNEVLTVGGHVKTNNQLNWFNQHMRGLETKAPRKVVEDAMTDVVI